VVDARAAGGGYRNIDRLFDTRVIRRAANHLLDPGAARLAG
jgi:hypothetical protein